VENLTGNSVGKLRDVLTVDDDPIVRHAIKTLLSKDFNVVAASSYKDAIRVFNGNDVVLAILDIDLNDVKTGFELLIELKKQNPTLPVIMLSNSHDADVVVKCMKVGAYDYIAKQDLASYDNLRIKIYNCFSRELDNRIIKEYERLFDENYPIIFKSSAMQQVLVDIETADDMNILIEGETGVGKTPIAKYANFLASQKTSSARPFVRINCAGLSRERLQADLFGHKKGSFTGAISDNRGLVELAKDGDLFMDEVADMDLMCQAELLTFLDSGEYRRLGDPVVRHSNCRIITASNLSLKSRIGEGTFRPDLYSRLSQYKVKVLPLRDRKEDIKPIMEYYINKFCGYRKKYSRDILGVYMHHDWREGNIRELRDAVKCMCTKSKESDEIMLSHVSGNYYSSTEDIGEVNIDMANMKKTIVNIGYDSYVSNLERIILGSLVNDEKSIRSLSKKIKVTDVTLGRKLRKYNIAIQQ